MSIFICEKQGHCCPHEFYDRIEQAISDSEDGIPCEHLVEVYPVVHGRWIETKNGFHCSNCKRKPGRHPTQKGVFLSDYCPHCGAIMDGEDGKADGTI